MKLKVALTIFGLVSEWSWGYYIPSVLKQPATVIFFIFFYLLFSHDPIPEVRRGTCLLLGCPETFFDF